MKPRIVYLEHRFNLLYAGALALALWLIAASLFVGRYLRPGPAEEGLTLYLALHYLLIAAGTALAVLSVYVFRREHRKQLWEPLERVRRMVEAVRRGELNVASEVPESIELGALVKSFLEMAAALREMRASLEEKVRERTASLEAAQKELIEAAKLSALGQLVGGVAHEVNNPLTSILGFTEILLLRSGLDPSVRKPLEKMREESLRLKHLVLNLSSFARRAPQRNLRFDLRRVLDRLVELRRYQLLAADIILHFDRGEKALCVQGDPDQILQVFFHLVLNAEQAIRAEDHPGEIWIACGAADGVAWATVRDNGPGIAREIREHIFEPFFTTRPPGRGSGLGLSVSHGIVQQHGGEIRVEPQASCGTTIRIELPLAPAGPAGGENETQECWPTAPALPLRGRALVLDDEPGVTEMLRMALERLGYTPTVLAEPRGLESLLDQSSFDLVLSDLKMPGRNGLEVYRLLRRSHPRLASRFLLLTGNLAELDDAGGAEPDLPPVLRKPFTLGQLCAALEQISESHA